MTGSITVQNLGKAYKVYPSRFDRLREWLTPFSKPRHALKWVLQDISFTVDPGQAVGIVGVNGAGKSTLLKMLTGTTQPTTGSVQIKGTVAALLELGIGFHPEFTGRQNAVMAGQLLGLNTEEVQRLMPEIEAFADIGDYIDQPLRVYSSGMQMRLAFSVATARRPDILIVDEALSVGDANFQHKSFERIRQFRKDGTTLLIVSHDRQAILSICDRAILLSNGSVQADDTPPVVMGIYNAHVINNANNSPPIEPTWSSKLSPFGNGYASVVKVGFYNELQERTNTLVIGENIVCRICIAINGDISRLVVGYEIKDRLGQTIFGTNTKYTNQVIHNCRKDSTYQYDIHFNVAMGVGSYSLATALVDTDGAALFSNYEWSETSATFSVINTAQDHFNGCVWIPPKFVISRL